MIFLKKFLGGRIQFWESHDCESISRYIWGWLCPCHHAILLCVVSQIQHGVTLLSARHYSSILLHEEGAWFTGTCFSYFSDDSKWNFSKVCPLVWLRDSCGCLWRFDRIWSATYTLVRAELEVAVYYWGKFLKCVPCSYLQLIYDRASLLCCWELWRTSCFLIGQSQQPTLPNESVRSLLREWTETLAAIAVRW